MLMRVLLGLPLAAFSWLTGYPQWVAAGMPFNPPVNQVFHFSVDSLNSTLYMAGQLRNSPSQYCALAYHNGNWEQLGYFNNSAYSICAYHDTVIIAGAFTTINGMPIPYVACWDGSNWQPYGSFNRSVRRVEVINGELFALGSFDTIDGTFANKIAKRIGNSWHAVGSLTCDTQGCTTILRDIATYNGDIVVCGTFFLNGLKDVMRFDGTDWLPLGEGLHGDNAVTALQEYNGDLYISGTIDINAGNAGHAIVRWDGQEFHGLGIGPQLIYNSYQYLYRVNSMTVHRGKLIAGGGFQYANLVPASMVAAWDGTEWCGVGGYTEGEVLSVTVFQDTLWAGCWGGDGTFNGQDMNGVAKYVWPEYADTCSDGTIGIADRGGPQPVRVWPTPANATLHMAWGAERTQEAEWVLRNAQGELVLQGTSRQRLMDVSGLPAGLFLLSVKGSAAVKVLIE